MTPSLLHEIEAKLDDFPRGETRFARWVLKFPEDASQLTIQELAERAGTSEPTIVRFSKRLGCKGFREFKLKLSEFIQQRKNKSSTPSLPQDPFMADQLVLSRSLKHLQDCVLQSLPSADLKNFLTKLVEAKQVLIVSDPELREMAEIAFHKLIPFTKRLSLCSRKEDYAGMIGRLNKSDVILILHQGNFEILKPLNAAKSKKILLAALGQLPVEPTVDIFLGTPEFSKHIELSILMSLIQVCELLPKHAPEAQKNAESFYYYQNEGFEADPLKPLQGELFRA